MSFFTFCQAAGVAINSVTVKVLNNTKSQILFTSLDFWMPSGGSRNRWWRGMWSKPRAGVWGGGTPPHGGEVWGGGCRNFFFQFWTLKWPVSVNCGCRWGDACIILILPPLIRHCTLQLFAKDLNTSIKYLIRLYLSL